MQIKKQFQSLSACLFFFSQIEKRIVHSVEYTYNKCNKWGTERRLSFGPIQKNTWSEIWQWYYPEADGRLPELQPAQLQWLWARNHAVSNQCTDSAWRYFMTQALIIFWTWPMINVRIPAGKSGGICSLLEKIKSIGLFRFCIRKPKQTNWCRNIDWSIVFLESLWKMLRQDTVLFKWNGDLPERFLYLIYLTWMWRNYWMILGHGDSFLMNNSNSFCNCISI